PEMTLAQGMLELMVVRLGLEQGFVEEPRLMTRLPAFPPLAKVAVNAADQQLGGCELRPERRVGGVLLEVVLVERQRGREQVPPEGLKPRRGKQLALRYPDQVLPKDGASLGLALHRSFALALGRV